MLQTKSEGEFLIQELDINLESEQIDVVIVSDSEMNTKRKEKQKKQESQNQSSLSNKKKKKQDEKLNIQCKNKFFTNLQLQEDQLLEAKPTIQQSTLNFGQGAKQISSDIIVKQAEKFQKSITWSDQKKTAIIPQQLLPDEIQDIQFLIPKIQGVNDQICTNTLYLNKIKDKIKIQNIIPHQQVQLKPQSREQFVQQLKNIQLNQNKNQKKTK